MNGNLKNIDNRCFDMKMKLQNITDVAAKSSCGFFHTNIENGGVVKCIVANDCASKYSRKEIDRLTLLAKKYHAGGLAWIKFENGELNGSVAKFFDTDESSQALINTLNLKENDLVLIVSDKLQNANDALGALRLTVAKEQKMINNDLFNFLWVVDWPLFEYNEEEGRYEAAHHPFTSPKAGDEDRLISDPASCHAKAYDIVLNGYELGGGSIRIHDQNIQQKMFQAIGLTADDIENKFGFFVEALKYGTPPHGGLAIGLDRLCMLLAKKDNLREVIAFPKAASAKCLMSNAPTPVENFQLKELGIQVTEEDK